MGRDKAAFQTSWESTRTGEIELSNPCSLKNKLLTSKCCRAWESVLSLTQQTIRSSILELRPEMVSTRVLTKELHGTKSHHSRLLVTLQQTLLIVLYATSPYSARKSQWGILSLVDKTSSQNIGTTLPLIFVNGWIC
jgi:hypothetical protein